MRSLPFVVEIVPAPTHDPTNWPKPESARCAKLGDARAMSAIEAAPAKISRRANAVGLLSRWFDPTISSDHAVVRPLHPQRSSHLGERAQKQRFRSGAIRQLCRGGLCGIARQDQVLAASNEFTRPRYSPRSPRRVRY